ncbi:MAG: hypothetical protein IKZ96_01460 [Bacilli bacterium]|nr:hypothetical protein [Bacilli bacterium]
MKKIKIVFLALLLLLITGCAGTYNLNIDENLAVKEELSINFIGEASNYNKINDLLKREEVNEDDYTLVVEGDNLKLDYSHEYVDLEEYLLKSLLYRQLFDSISYNSDNKEVSLSTGNIFNASTNKLYNSYNIKSLQINVTTPLEVIEENAEKISENTYSWTIDNTTREKYMYLTFNKSDNLLNKGTVIVLSVSIIAIAIMAIIIIKRLSESRKI